MSRDDDGESDGRGIGGRTSRRAVLRAVGTAGLVGSGVVGAASAGRGRSEAASVDRGRSRAGGAGLGRRRGASVGHGGGPAGATDAESRCADATGPCEECRDTGCAATRGSCVPCLEGCDPIDGSRIEAGADFPEERHCLEVPASAIPDAATTAVIKAANECHECSVADPTEPQTFCVGSKHAIGHVEFAKCADASIAADCGADEATVTVEGPDAVHYAVTYRDCDAGDASGELAGGGDPWSASIPLADCEGTVAVRSAPGGTLLASATVGCEAAGASVDCDAGEATVSAADATSVAYAVDYDDCDAADVAPTTVDLGGETDETTVPLAACGGTITVTDGDGTVLDEQNFDCGSITDLAADCGADAVTVTAPATNELWYEVEYPDCDVADVQRSRVTGLSATSDTGVIPIPADCQAVVRVYADETSASPLATTAADCVAADASVDCAAGQATVTVPDAEVVYYQVDYANCAAGDVGPRRADLSGSTDAVTVSLADCAGTVTVTDELGDVLDAASFDCASGGR